MRPWRFGQAGVSLVEALVALAVMAFGMMAVVGLQSTLRQSADMSKQRAEAVRIAQEEIERWRAFALLQDPTGIEPVTYGNLQGGTEAAVTGSNAQYTLTRSVDTTSPLYKTLVVDVAWTDRSNQPQNVRLSTAIAAVAPELAGTLSMPANGVPTRQPGARHPAIPRPAMDLGDGTSAFRPPQAEDGHVAWVFNNDTALITSCITTAASTSALALDNISACTDARAQLLSGFVRFATGPTQPTAADAEAPASAAQSVQVRVLRTAPTELTVECFEDLQPLFVSYYCAVPTSTDPLLLPLWSGRSIVTGLSALTDDANEAGADRLRVCRYTRYRDDREVPAIKNEEHPRDYAGVGRPLANQNFLVIRAGNGSSAFDCPADDTTTPSIDSTTWRHP